jgi:hypothetical protein
VIGETGICPRVSSPPSFLRKRLPQHSAASLAATIVLFGGLCIAARSASSVDKLVLSIDDINHPAVALQGVTMKLQTVGNILQLNVTKLRLLDRSYSDVRVTCPRFDWHSDRLTCKAGQLKTGSFAAGIDFDYSIAEKKLNLALAPGGAENWRALVAFSGESWQGSLEASAAQVARFSSFLPKDSPAPSQGTLNGTLALQGKGTELARVNADLVVDDLNFADPTGLHAGEKVAASLKLVATRVGGGLNWNTDIVWNKGEVFWSPLYIPNGGHRLRANGDLENERLHVAEGNLQVAQLGAVQFSADWNMKSGLQQGTASANQLDAKALYALLLKPFLDKTALDALDASGQITFELRYADATLQQVDLQLHDVSIDDQGKRFAIQHLNGSLPWKRKGASDASLAFAGASLFGIPIGKLQTRVKSEGFDFAIDELELPILDGKLAINAVRVWQEDNNWRWKFNGVLLPISMEALTKAIGGPVMLGVLAATIPDVTYADGRVDVGGAVAIRVFDGDVVVDNVILADFFGRAPRLHADVQMHNLDLGLLTSTFKFGSIDGRIDADVKDLELSNWKPVKFDARVQSSPGNYRKKISQQAVQNISSLGGAGAAAAIQRSFLGFFKEFGYDRIGLSCRLRNNVCEMGGVASTPQGYIIVKGGGIPAITVLGYNRSVGWNELIERLSRVIQSNAQPIIR